MYSALGPSGSEGETGNKSLHKFEVSVCLNMQRARFQTFPETIDNALAGNKHLLAFSDKTICAHGELLDTH